MEVNIDQNKCIGCSLCSDLFPEIFLMKKDKAVLRMKSLPDKFAFPCKAMHSQCPVEAIELLD